LNSHGGVFLKGCFQVHGVILTKEKGRIKTKEGGGRFFVVCCGNFPNATKKSVKNTT
jgi:hypothetical protein